MTYRLLTLGHFSPLQWFKDHVEDYESPSGESGAPTSSLLIDNTPSGISRSTVLAKSRALNDVSNSTTRALEKTKLHLEYLRKVEELARREDLVAQGEEEIAQRELVVALKELQKREQALVRREERLARREKDLRAREAAVSDIKDIFPSSDVSPAETVADQNPVDMLAPSKLFDKSIHRPSTSESVSSPSSQSSDTAFFEHAANGHTVSSYHPSKLVLDFHHRLHHQVPETTAVA